MKRNRDPQSRLNNILRIVGQLRGKQKQLHDKLRRIDAKIADFQTEYQDVQKEIADEIFGRNDDESPEPRVRVKEIRKFQKKAKRRRLVKKAFKSTHERKLKPHEVKARERDEKVLALVYKNAIKGISTQEIALALKHPLKEIRLSVKRLSYSKKIICKGHAVSARFYPAHRSPKAIANVKTKAKKSPSKILSKAQVARGKDLTFMAIRDTGQIGIKFTDILKRTKLTKYQLQNILKSLKRDNKIRVVGKRFNARWTLNK